MNNQIIKAMDSSWAIAEFDSEGKVLDANKNFLETFHFNLDDIKAKHHSIFCTKDYAKSQEYKDFWRNLNEGLAQKGQFHRLDKYGQSIYIQASYNPIKNKDGKVSKIIKFAQDISEQKQLNLYHKGQIDAIKKSQAVIEFNPNGIILDANENFLNTMGYRLEEIQGNPHSIFCEEAFVRSDEYKTMWENLRAGKHYSGQFKRINKSGLPIWIQATYNPILGIDGKVFKIVKFAHNVTKEKELSLYNQGQIEAINRSQAVIEFDKNGVILNANYNFLHLMGYNLEEIKGKHHSIFCDHDYIESDKYKNFWETLKKGQYHNGQYKRFNKNQKTVWIQASYNPIFGIDGDLIKIIKFAHDITAEKKKNLYFEGQIEAINLSQAVIEFDINGVILRANNNFLNTLGYTLEDVQGKHHSIFCDAKYTNTKDYRDFWEKLKKGQFHSGQYKRLNKQGDIVWIRATYNPVKGVDGKVKRIVKFAHDITNDQKLSLYHSEQLDAISKAQAVVEFDIDGNILNANENFLNLMRYKLEEIKGKNHKIFCHKELADSQYYIDKWKQLQNGKFHAGSFKRQDKYGQTVWIQASYNPIYGMDGKIERIIKFAHDITAEKELSLYHQEQIKAISKAQAVVEFDVNGIILNANENFLKATGYSLEEIKDKHHDIFCEKEYKNSRSYKDFWNKLSKGRHQSGQYKRINKEGKIMWLRATYNPILGIDGEVIKIVKFAHDITADQEISLYHRGQLEAIGKSQAVIEFDTKGNILDANKNFLSVFKYQLDEITGKHHSIFCDKKLVKSPRYEKVWKSLQSGKHHAGQYKRLDKNGKIIWIQATYNPIKDVNGDVIKIVKFAHDITEEKEQSLYHQGQIEAISKSQAVVEFDTNGVVLNANENFLDTFGYQALEIKNAHHSLFCDKDYTKSKEYEDFWKLLKDGKYHSGQFKRINKKGKTVWIRATYNPIKGVDGDVIKIVKFAHDITNDQEISLFHKAQIEAINRSQAVVEFDMNGTVLNANENFLNAMNYSLEEIKGKHHSLFCLKDYAISPQYYKFWEKLQSGKHDSGKYLRIGKDGKQVWIRATYTPILNIDNKPIRILKYAQDITELETIKIDKLTGLYNQGKLVSDIKNNTLNNLAILDSNEFSTVRDFYGIIAGDTLIVQFARLLKENISKDFILYRLHNDRFAVLNHNKSKDEFEEAMEILRLKVIASSIDAQISQLNLSLNFGLAYGKDDLIINQARTAHNYAKNTNKVMIRYSKALYIQEQFQEKIFWSKKINLAIKEDRIIVHFQPVFNNKTKKIEKHEVLVRAIDQDESLIFPNKFLDIAKTSHQYHNITKIVIAKSFKRFQNLPLDFSINLTIGDIMDKDLQKFLLESIIEYNVGRKLVIELVENEQISEYKPISNFIKKLKKLGVKLAIDDFGSGYSNFGYLLELDADFVKIDGSIVSKVLENDYSSEIIASIVSFCKKMNITTIAEFVSSKEILEKVTELGVDYSQGFYTGRPEEKVIY